MAVKGLELDMYIVLRGISDRKSIQIKRKLPKTKLRFKKGRVVVGWWRRNLLFSGVFEGRRSPHQKPWFYSPMKINYNAIYTGPPYWTSKLWDYRDKELNYVRSCIIPVKFRILLPFSGFSFVYCFIYPFMLDLSFWVEFSTEKELSGLNFI